MATYPDDADGDVLAELAEQGIDLTQPLSIEFAIAAPDEPSAEAIAKLVTKSGYVSQIEYDEGEPDEDGEIDPDDEEFGPSWTVIASVTMIPEYNAIVRIQAELDELAEAFGGNSDGWGVLIEGSSDADDME